MEHPIDAPLIISLYRLWSREVQYMTFAPPTRRQVAAFRAWLSETPHAEPTDREMAMLAEYHRQMVNDEL